jgi:ribosomal protein L14E/L6E/L27E
MNKLQIGSVVKATAGRDNGKLFVVVAIENEYVFIADGKSRKLAMPKRKNPKHIWPTNQILQTESVTDKQLRKTLRMLACAEI